MKRYYVTFDIKRNREQIGYLAVVFALSAKSAREIFDCWAERNVKGHPFHAKVKLADGTRDGFVNVTITESGVALA